MRDGGVRLVKAARTIPIRLRDRNGPKRIFTSGPAGPAITGPAGQPGPAGHDGARGATGGPGPIGLTPWAMPTPWQSGTPYVATAPASAVTYNGQTYVCIVAHLSSASFDANLWVLIAARGADGSAATTAAPTAFTHHATAPGAQTITLPQTPTGFIGGYLDGLRQEDGLFTLSGATVTVSASLGVEAGDLITIEYEVGGSSGGSSGSGSGSGSGAGADALTPARLRAETPIGAVDGTNATFTLTGAPVAGSLLVFVSGQLMQPGFGADYTANGAILTFAAPPPVASIPFAYYFR